MKSHSFALVTLAVALCNIALCSTGDPLAAQDPQLLRQEDARLLHRSNTAVAAEPATVTEAPASFPSLSPRADLEHDGVQSAVDSRTGSGQFAGPTITVASSLAVVLGLFAGLVWVTRKFGSRSMGQGVIPKEVMQSLGSAPIDSRTRVTLLRCGNRILILAQSATGIQPISEITQPDEVRALTAACLGDSRKEFASTLQSLEREETQPGYLGDQTDAHRDRNGGRDRGRLFATA